MLENDKNGTPTKLIQKHMFTKKFKKIFKKLTSRNIAQTPNCSYKGQQSFGD
jgi:hypothetical protein